MRLSPHFREDEFRDRRTGHVHVDPELVQALERLRTLCKDSPLSIVSGYRSRSTNTLIGGALRSQHLTGRAADIPYGYATFDQARRAGFRGVGTKGRWAVHVDVRPGSFVTWSYS